MPDILIHIAEIPYDYQEKFLYLFQIFKWCSCQSCHSSSDNKPYCNAYGPCCLCGPTEDSAQRTEPFCRYNYHWSIFIIPYKKEYYEHLSNKNIHRLKNNINVVQIMISHFVYVSMQCSIHSATETPRHIRSILLGLNV